VESTVAFLPGLELSQRFFHEAVEPILARQFPDLRYGAGRLASGSEVLGFDTPQSRDHDWGPQVEIFLSEQDSSEDRATAIKRLMAEALPFEVAGYSTHFADIQSSGGRMAATNEHPITHKVRPTTARRFFVSYLGVDPLAEAGLRPAEWLAVPEQHLRTVVSGGIFRDDLGELERARASLRWYPYDLWLYLLAAQWRRIEQEEAFVGRAGDVGAELGSRVVAARLVRELMRLCFLMENQYAPYAKWFGTAFARLECAPRIAPSLTAALSADTWHDRERALADAYTVVAEMHNALGITEPLPTVVSSFHGRPYQVIHGDVFWQAILRRITDPAVRSLPRAVGSISQWVDSTDAIWAQWFGPLRRLYGEVAELERARGITWLTR
jgi:hypothetical protein